VLASAWAQSDQSTVALAAADLLGDLYLSYAKVHRYIPSNDTKINSNRGVETLASFPSMLCGRREVGWIITVATCERLQLPRLVPPVLCRFNHPGAAQNQQLRPVEAYVSFSGRQGR